jgi:septal ring factor EnvC (AmiA/AmiB activator)
MSNLGEVVKAVKEVLLLSDKVDRIGQTLSEISEVIKAQDKEIRDIDKRIIRLETMVEMARSAPAPDPQLPNNPK